MDFRFGTVGAPISTPKKPGGSVGACKRLCELELNALELGWVNSVRVSEATCQLIAGAGVDQDVAISVHAPYFINLNAGPDEWPKSRKRLMDAAHYGNLAGATDIVFHPGSYFGQPPSDVLETVIPRLQECVSDLRLAGNPAILRPETMGKSAMLGSLEDTIEMSHRVEGVLPCVDFAHLYARTGDGTINNYDEWSLILEKIGNALGNAALQVMHIHLSGIEYGPKGEKNHLKVEESQIDINSLFKALKSFHCQGRILCESPAMEDDALLLKALYLSAN